MTKIRILLADDHKILREGLRMLINAQPQMAVIAEAKNGLEVVTLTKRLQPDVVIMDISMPLSNGLKAAEKLRDMCPGVKILILTRHSDDGYVQQLLRAGVSGYALKQSASDDLVRAIRAVHAGQRYLDPAITGQIVGAAVVKPAARGAVAAKNLSPREEAVLRLIAKGYLHKEIAARLQISIKTAEAHKANAMAKMGMKGRIDIVRYALLQGWLQDT
jgi:DNA-binding NarL/FixJ family response regulator